MPDPTIISDNTDGLAAVASEIAKLTDQVSRLADAAEEVARFADIAVSELVPGVWRR